LKEKQRKKQNRCVRFLSELFRTKPLAGLGLVILVVLVVVAVFADQLAPYPMVDGQLQVDVLNKLAPVSLEHPLGTDTLGRDLLSYLIYGARTSVILCVACTILSTILSTAIGVSSAVLGGTYDMVVQRFVDAWQCIPAMLILLILMVLMGNGTIQLILAISVPAGIAGSRLVRSAAMSVKASGYVKMSNMLGSGAIRKMWHHVLPNILPIIIINMAGSLGGVVMQEASLNFLGYGVDPGTPSWGYPSESGPSIGTPAASGTPVDPGEPQYGGNLTVYFQEFYNDYDPSVADMRNYCLWFEPLFTVKWDMENAADVLTSEYMTMEWMEGQIAESYTFENGDLTVKIREDVFFQNKEPYNGRQLTANDVKWSYDRLLGTGSGFDTPYECMMPWHMMLNMVESIEVTGDFEVVFHFNTDSELALNSFITQQVNIAGPE